MDLTCAYGLLTRNKLAMYFFNSGGQSTGKYRFETELYGLTTMPAEFQIVMDSILSEFPQARPFIVDILVVIKGSEIEHTSV